MSKRKKPNKANNYFNESELVKKVSIPVDIIPQCQILEIDFSTNTEQIHTHVKDFVISFLKTQREPDSCLKYDKTLVEQVQRQKQVRSENLLNLNLNYNIAPAKCLSSNYAISPNSQKIICYLYRIGFTGNQLKQSKFGFIMAEELKVEFPIMLINHTTHKIQKCIIQRENELTINEGEFNLLILYHMKLCYDIFLTKKLTEEEYQNGINKIYDKNLKGKKYLFVPLKEDSFSGTYFINWDKVKYCYDIYMNKVDRNKNSLYAIIDKFIEDKKCNLKCPSEKIQKMINQIILSSNLFFTEYKNCNIYDIIDLFYADENYITFLQKLSCYNDEYAKHVTDKYFPKVKEVDQSKISTYDIMSSFDVKAPSVLGYRDLYNKYNIQYNFTPNCYSYGKKMNFIYDSVLYDKNIPHNTLKENPNKEEKKNIVHLIFPIDIMIQNYFSKKDLEIIYKFPSIMTTFESMLIAYEAISDWDVFDMSKFNYTVESFKYFLWALTTPTSIQDYDYETLETLGDSILKILVTTTLYCYDLIENKKYLAGDLEKYRAFLISNKHLFRKGKSIEIYKYIISKQLDIKVYEFPLKVSSQIEHHMDITEKIIADVVEASIGAIFLAGQDFTSCYKFIRKICLFDNKEYIHKEVGAISIEKEKIFQMVFNILKMSKNFNYPDISFHSSNESFISLIESSGQKYIEPQFIVSIDDLENNCLNYKFKNRKLLLIALTHKSVNADPAENYEILEFLGDSIVEAFISCSTFNIFAPYLYLDQEELKEINEGSELEVKKKIKGRVFNNVKMTHIKSLLCSNNFMCKISAFLHLPQFFMCNRKEISIKIATFNKKENLTKIFNRKLDDYENYKALTPKIIADIFEAIVGAIFIDSDLENCYQFLNKVYGPFISYSAEYFDELKYSVVNDFTLISENMLKIVPEFSIKEEGNNKEVIVEIYLDGKYLCTGKGSNIEVAKQHASLEGIKKLREQFQDS